MERIRPPRPKGCEYHNLIQSHLDDRRKGYGARNPAFQYIFEAVFELHLGPDLQAELFPNNVVGIVNARALIRWVIGRKVYSG